MTTHHEQTGPQGPELPPTLASGAETDASTSGDLVGRVLAGRYRILRKLGEGAMGAVYLGEHLKIGRKDAIKVLRDQLASDPDAIARFVRGTRNVSMIRHPNICTIYDYSDTADGIQFVAMEFVPGETLRDLLNRETRLPVDTAVKIAIQVAEALDAAHQVGIVHRDLKPANIMVVQGRQGLEVKVVDFDIAKGSQEGEGEEVTRMGFVVGTPEYMSPEQLIGDRLDGRSDVYSLALVLYRMLTGTLPFAAQDTQDLMVKRLTEEPMSLAGGLPGASFPLALEMAIRRALQRKPEDRQRTAAEFAQEVAAAVSPVVRDRRSAPRGDTSASTRETERSRTDSSETDGRRRLVLLWGGGATAAVALVALGLFAFGGEGGEGGEELATDTPSPQTPMVEYSDPVSTAEDEASGSPAEPEADTAALGSAPSAQGTRQTTSVAAEPAGNPPEEARAEGAPAEPSTAVSASPSQDELLSMLERTMDPGSSGPALREIHQRAADAWNDRTIPSEHRALAAYVASNSLIALGDTTQAVTWLQRAVDLRPDYDPYRTELNLYQQLLRGY